MPVFEPDSSGKLIKKPILVVITVYGYNFLVFSDTWQYLEFRSNLELVTFPRYFQIGGIFIWIQSKDELEKLFKLAELPQEFLGLKFTLHMQALNNFYPIDSPN